MSWGRRSVGDHEEGRLRRIDPDWTRCATLPHLCQPLASCPAYPSCRRGIPLRNLGAAPSIAERALAIMRTRWFRRVITAVDIREDGRDHQPHTTSTPSLVKKSVAPKTAMCIRMNSYHAPSSCAPGPGDAMALEDIADGLVADRIAQVAQSAHNPVIAPRAVLSGHPHHQAFDLLGQCEDVQQP